MQTIFLVVFSVLTVLGILALVLSIVLCKSADWADSMIKDVLLEMESIKSEK